eukprot:TRINITY_DN864_c0_g1_i8.p1 TRINITY_DN864_c0_g1~~TRINITY_DN864_c0_g1_i8.p1  ORF type:complete len:378 (-),score=16.94 TRINITY_DN864_c0_g1_i8:186-1187(-)
MQVNVTVGKIIIQFFFNIITWLINILSIQQVVIYYFNLLVSKCCLGTLVIIIGGFQTRFRESLEHNQPSPTILNTQPSSTYLAFQSNNNLSSKVAKMFYVIVILCLILCVAPQSVIDISAAGATPTSQAAATALGSGAAVTGSASVQATNSAAAAFATVTAVGSKPVQKPSKPVSIYKPVYSSKPVHHKVYPYPVYVSTKYHKQPVCEDIKDDKCYAIDNYYYCGFCILKKYPLHGYACKYTEQKVLKTSQKASKKAYAQEYETIIVPKCKCDGEFIVKGEYCPGCDYILSLLLKCAGIKNSQKGNLDIPERCLKEVGVTLDILANCGFAKGH